MSEFERRRKAQFRISLVLATIASALVFAAFGLLGLIGMGGGLGEQFIISGLVVIALAALPLGLLSTVWVGSREGMTLPGWLKYSPLGIAALLVVLGLFSVVVDPGDAFWAGVPMLILSALIFVVIGTYPSGEEN